MGKNAIYSKPSFEAEAQFVWAVMCTGIVLVTTTIATRVAFLIRHLGRGESNEDLIRDVEFMDRLIWLAVLVLAGIYFLKALLPSGKTNFSPKREGAPEIIGISTLLLGVLWVEPLSNYGGMWFGFGNTVALATVIAVPVAIWIGTRASKHSIEAIGWTSSVWVLLAYTPLAIQPLWGIADPHHSRYVYNEIVGPLSGSLALVDYVPQYTTLMGLPLAGLSSLGLADTSLEVGLATSMYLSLLAILTLLLLVYVGRLMLPPRFKSLAPLALVPIALVKSQPPLTDTGSITTMLSAVPVRTLPLMLIAILLARASTNRTIRSKLLLGLGLGFAVVNNFEFGLVCSIASILVVAIQERQIRKSALGVLATVLSALLAPALYGAFVASTGKIVDWSYLTLFTKNFWAGFDNLPMPWVSPHYFILSIFVAGLAVGARFTIKFSWDTGVPRYRYLAAVLTTFFSLAGLGSFGYFIGRSVVSTQLQIFLCFCAPVSLGLTVLLLTSKKYILARLNLRKVFVFLPIAISLATVMQAPDVGYEWRRVLPTTFEKLSRDPYLDGVTRAEKAIAVIEEDFRLAKSDLVLSVENGNYISAVLDVVSISVLDDPSEAAILSPELSSAFCRRITSQPKAILAEGFLDEQGKPLCLGFTSAEPVAANYWLVKY